MKVEETLSNTTEQKQRCFGNVIMSVNPGALRCNKKLQKLLKLPLPCPLKAAHSFIKSKMK